MRGIVANEVCGKPFINHVGLASQTKDIAYSQLQQ